MWSKEEKDCVYEWNKPEGVSEDHTLYVKPHLEKSHGGYAGRHLPPAPKSLEKPQQSSNNDTLGSRVPINMAY